MKGVARRVWDTRPSYRPITFPEWVNSRSQRHR